MSTAFFDPEYVDPCENEPLSITVDMRRPNWRDVVRAKAERDAEWLFQDPATLDELMLFDECGPGIYATFHNAVHFRSQSMSIPREAFRDLLQAKRQRGILQRVYQRYLEQAVAALLCARQAARARRSRQRRKRS